MLPFEMRRDPTFERAANSACICYAEDMSQTLMIARGLPGSGKSTFAVRWVSEKPAERARVNRDDLRFATFGKYVLEPDQEQVITAIEHAAVRALLASGKSVVVDNQNLRAKYIKPYLKLAAEVDAVVLHKDFNEELPELLRRNKARDKAVPEEYLTKAYKNFVRKGAFGPFPKLEEAQESSGFGPNRYIADTSLPTAWIVDMDGTLALMRAGGRSPYEYDRVLEDAPNEVVIELVRTIATTGTQIIIMSGREDSALEDTKVWLRAHVVPFDKIHMRATGDERRDSVVKLELFDAHVRGHYNVRGVLDDRDQVVVLWRSLGLTCFQVADGNF